MPEVRFTIFVKKYISCSLPTFSYAKSLLLFFALIYSNCNHIHFPDCIGYPCVWVLFRDKIDSKVSCEQPLSNFVSCPIH